jgi:archaellum component FlaC
MWLLYRLDKRNTEQHGQSIAIIQEVKQDVKDMKGDMHDVKADVRDLKSEVRRIDRATKPTRIKKSA